MSSCAVRSCSSRQAVDKKKSSGITFHRFPKNVIRQEAWVSFVNRKGWQPTNSSVLCSKHFLDECFDRTSQCVVRLKPDAVPTLNREIQSVSEIRILSEAVPRISRAKPVSIINEAALSTSSYCKAMIAIPSLLLLPQMSSHTKPLLLKRSARAEKKERQACVESLIGETSKVDEHGKVVIKPTLKTTSLEADMGNPNTSHKEFIIKNRTSMQRRSNKPNILKRSSKVSRSTSPNTNLKSVDALKNIKSQNPNIEIEYVDVKMENEDDIDQIVDEPNNVVDYNTSNCLVNDIVTIVDEPNNVVDDNTNGNLVGVGSSLEAKYNDLYKENQFLKHMLTKIGVFPNLECIEEYSINTESNHLIDLTDVQTICRVCLQKSDNFISMKEQMVFENKNILNMTVLKALQSILGETVDIADNIPHQICTQCRKHLKSFITFKYTFRKATSILHIFANGTFANINKQSVPTSAIEDHDYSKKSTLNDEKCCTMELETSETDTLTADDMSVLSENSEDLSKLKPPTIRKIFRHKVKKQTNKLHTCPICWTKISMSELIPHVKSHKTLQKYLSIPKVSLKTRFYAPARNVQGLLNGEGEKLHKCPICRYEFKATEFILHIHHHLTHDQFKCEKCHRSFKKKQYLLSHMLVAHSKTFPFRCEKCDKGFVIKSNYECHLLTHKDGELPHKCIECEKCFSNPIHLSRHMTIHTENRTYSTKYRYKRCKYCGEGFSNKEQLLEHVCHQYGVYKCKYCFKVFLNSRRRQLHTLKVHFNGKKNPGYCPICNLTFKNINYHKASKHPRENLKALCTVCGLYVTNIYIHIQKHRNVSTTQHYQCPICSKLFSYRTTLKQHLTIHSGVKPYICSFCGKAFNSIYNLQVHERIHVGDTSHVCPVCDKGFLEKSYLNRHMKTHKDVDVVSSDADYKNYTSVQIDQDL